MTAAKRVTPQQTGMQVGGVAGYVVSIWENGSVVADGMTALAALGPCDALKSDITITVDGTTADGTEVTGFPVTGGQWDPTSWKEIIDITGSNANVWIGWYRGMIQP